jgi:preprotein translocase subunit SecF
VVTVFASWGSSALEFEYDGRALQSDRARRATEGPAQLISEVFGKDIHAGILVERDLEAARATVSRVRQAHEQRKREGNTVIAEYFAAPDLLPVADIDLQARKEAIESLVEDDMVENLEEIAAGERTSTKRKISRDDARLMLDMLAAKPFSIEDLPPAVLAKVRPSPEVYAIFAYPNFDVANMKKGVEFEHETAEALGQAGGFVGEATIYAAMFLMLREEAPVILGISTVVIIVLVYWQVGSVWHAIQTLLPMILAFVWLLGLMGASGLKFTLFNLPIVPAVLGIGVDNGVYLTDRLRRAPGDPQALHRAFRETGGAILAATATTTIGFAALLMADSAGVRSIAEVAVLGIVLASIAAMLVVPALTRVR